MAISHNQHMPLTCPSCGGTCGADLWLILDAQEQPEQTSELYRGNLNMVACSHCGHVFQAGAALLFHDAATRTVIFAMPPGTEEYLWREQARDLHALLTGSIPPEERRAYLNDVQIAQDIAGMAHILRKMARQRQPGAAPEELPGKPITAVIAPEALPSARAPAPPPAAVEQPAEQPAHQADQSTLLTAVEALLTVSTPDEVRSLSQQHPVLLTTAADDALNQLADIAVEERDYDLASGLHQARLQLSSLRTYDPGIPGAAAEHAYPPAPATDSTLRREPEPVVVSALPPAAELPDELYEALLAVQTSQALGQLVQAQPVLLAPWVDVVLSDTVNQILDEGYERLAYDLEQRRELLAELRQQRASTDTSPAETTAAASAEPTEPAAPEEPSGVPPATQEAIEALLIAEDEDTMAQVLLEYPVLLTDAAQEALWHLSSEARTYGDEELARYAIECRATLRKVREGLADT